MRRGYKIAAAITFLFVAVVVVFVNIVSNDESSTHNKVSSSAVVSSQTDTTSAFVPNLESTTEENTSLSSDETSKSVSGHAPIYLTGGDGSSPYAHTIVLNAGSEDEIVRVVFFVNPHTYVLSNTLDKPVQYNIYSEETQMNGQFEEPAHSDGGLLQAYESATVIIKEGYYIYLSDGDSIRLLVKE